ncbi:MAG TPA: hypothetical protein VH253_00830 [Phycisphaerae bacterium]|nr:hypothetical protein [Phycisphaerae bacterium]
MPLIVLSDASPLDATLHPFFELRSSMTLLPALKSHIRQLAGE